MQIGHISAYYNIKVQHHAEHEKPQSSLEYRSCNTVDYTEMNGVNCAAHQSRHKPYTEVGQQKHHHISGHIVECRRCILPREESGQTRPEKP